MNNTLSVTRSSVLAWNVFDHQIIQLHLFAYSQKVLLTKRQIKKTHNKKGISFDLKS